MYDDILVPTDGSAGMQRIIDHATSLARKHEATLHGLYVVDTASWTGLPMESSFEGVGEALRDEGETALRELETRPDSVPVETEIRDGSPARQIVDFAAESGCDLIVMGTHGRAGVDRLLLGSVAERVVRSATVPVMTVRVSGSQDEQATGQDQRESEP
jgi:nucleotide-binding universal stress UspA family protein